MTMFTLIIIAFVVVLIALFAIIIEIQVRLDQAFMQEVFNTSINISVDLETFPKLFQQESIEAKQVS